MSKGYILTVVVIFIGSILSVVLIATALSSLNTLDYTDTLASSVSAEYGVESCVEEALLQLHRDDQYMGEQDFTLESTTCDITMSTSTYTTIHVTSTDMNGVSQAATVEVDIDTFEINSWSDGS